jgi:hypothetical protein
MVAALDPAFGGDECQLRLGKIGQPLVGPRVLEVGKKFLLKIKQKDPKPVHYQIAHQVMDICKEHKVDPRNFAMDSTGNGGGVASVLEAEWSPMIIKVEFGGAPTDRPISNMDPRTGKEAYDRRVTELCFAARELLEGGQLKGMDNETVRQFCARLYESSSKKRKVETKADMKARIGRSPDDMDCVCVMVELARQRGLATTGIPMRGGTLTDQRMKTALELDEVYRQEEPEGEPMMAWMESD